VDRWLLNTLSTWQLALLVVGCAVAFGLGGFALMHRFVPSLARHADNRSLSSAFSISSGLFSFVLAFTIGQLYTNFTHATADARQEATILAQVLRTSSGLPAPLAHRVRAEVLTYAGDVRTQEWKEMQKGGSSVRAWHDIDAMYSTLEAARKTTSSDPFYGQTLARLNDLVIARRTRLDDANLSLPVVFQVMLVLGALLALSTTFYFKPFGERIQVAMIGAAAALVGTAMLVALVLDYPYSGSVAVSSAPFAASSLLLLAGG
jgi:Protein of unknown function (DUF4239)